MEPGSTNKHISHTDFGLHGSKTDRKRVLFLTWSGNEETGRAGLTTQGQKYSEVTLFPTLKLPLVDRRHGCLQLGYLTSFHSQKVQRETRKKQRTRKVSLYV